MKVSAADSAAWGQLQVALKEGLCSTPAGVAAKNFTEIEPGQNDFDTCFRAWWPLEIRRMPKGVLVRTFAENEDATERGIEKYRGRLQGLVRKHFLEDVKLPVTIQLVRAAKAGEARADAHTNGNGNGHANGNGRVTSIAAEAGDPMLGDLLQIPDKWEQVKAELAYRLRTLPTREQRDAMANFDAAIRPAKLLSIEMDGTAPVWKLTAINPKKTMAVLGVLRRHVTPAIQAVAGAEVQIVVSPIGGS